MGQLNNLTLRTRITFDGRLTALTRKARGRKKNGKKPISWFSLSLEFFTSGSEHQFGYNNISDTPESQHLPVSFRRVCEFVGSDRTLRFPSRTRRYDFKRILLTARFENFEMELKHVIATLIKILISTLLIASLVAHVHGAALMGGHIDNVNHPQMTRVKADVLDNEYGDVEGAEDVKNETASNTNSEEIPDPSALVLPGYNLPENIFNHGKPFYVEKDPLTGKLDFDQKSPSLKPDDDFYDYVDEETHSDDIYDKSNIDRKDGSVSSHKRNDVNQLTPNFHDFLNLPVKYNPQKYVYPLISSSYASTKIQGSVNKLHNHKDYQAKTPSTKKPAVSPTYYTTGSYFNPRTTQRTASTTSVTTTTAPTTRRYPEIYLTTTMVANILNSGMSHPSFNAEYEYYDSQETTTTTTTTAKHGDASKAPPTATTTKRTLSLFEQLFGDYDETVTTTQKSKPPPLFANLPNKTTTTTTEANKNVLTGTHMGLDSSYEYDDNYPDDKYDDNVAVENKISSDDSSLKVEPLVPKTTTPETHTEINVTTITTTSTATTTTVPTTTPLTSTARVTSLPLGENHIHPDPIIVATQNLREKLNGEKVVEQLPPSRLAPSKSSIHIAPDQDTVSFVVGNQQSVEGGHYVGTSLKESPYDSNPFRPLYGQHATNNDIEAPPIESAVTIQPLKNSEASLAIGVPVVKQVVDEKQSVTKSGSNKVVFPQDTPQFNREVLKLNSKPMYHQLPSDLTPPKQKESSPSRFDRPVRPPWDPRPGHFYSGTPEYARPPRPRPEVAYKRIDNLPNILPQFRPNANHHPPPPPPYYFDKRLNRQPLLERPSNRPVGHFEKMAPPRPYLRKTTQYLEERRPSLNLQRLDQAPAEDRIFNGEQTKSNGPRIQDLNLYQTPPNVQIANRRRSDVEAEVETLQMIQAKNGKDKGEEQPQDTVRVPAETAPKDDKTIYKVYPVNTAPIKLDAIDMEKKEGVVIGTRAEMPLPPSKIDNDFNYEQQDRNDAPVLKPHSKPSFPAKSDFPYHLERPNDAAADGFVNPQVLSNQWNSIEEATESKIVTEKPIAVAYTPTESHLNPDKYSMPNYGSPVIPEIRPGSLGGVPEQYHQQFNHKSDTMESVAVEHQDFQAPFQASLKLDTAINQGWHVVRGKNKTTLIEATETTTLPLATTSEFDIENFKPQLIGGFKPLYAPAEDPVNERQEK